MKKLLAMLLAALMLVCVGAAALADASITFQMGGEPECMDPTINDYSSGSYALQSLFRGLYKYDADGALVPAMAESYEVSEDGCTYTFKLKEGLKWSDGSPLTAHDFEYSWKRVLNPEVGSETAYTLYGVIKDGYECFVNKTVSVDDLPIRALDDTTFQVELKAPASYFLTLTASTAFMPVSQANVEKYGEDWANSPETYVCNGPYTITEWTPSEKIVCKKNENYKGGWDSSKIVNDKLTFLLLEDSSASYTAYTGGTAQLIKDVPTEEIPTLKKDKKDEFNVDPILGTYYLSMNLNKAPFNNKNVRKALSLAIDRDYVANTVMQGTYTPAYNYVGTGVDDVETGKFLENSKAANGGKTYISEDYKANLEEAKKALAEAGYPEGKGFPTITYSTNDTGYHKALAEYLQQVYKDLGITMNIDIVDWSSFTPKRRAGEYEMARNGWVMDYNDASNMIELFTSTNGNNDGKYNNPAFDKAMNDSKVADKTAHFAALHEAEKIVSEDYGFIPVAYYNDFWLQSTSLKGTWHSPYGYWYLQYAYLAD